MSILITEVRDGYVTMSADTRETSFETGGARVLESGKILKTETADGKDVLIGVVGNSNHFGLLTFITHKIKIAGDSYDDLFQFFAGFYDEADQRGTGIFHADGGSFSEFHIAFANRAWLVRGLTIEPISLSATSGSGADLAFGAMAVGATSFQAIKVACDYNAFCSFPVDIWHARPDGTFSHDRVNRDLSDSPIFSHTPPTSVVEVDS